jgi:hypothetical protein
MDIDPIAARFAQQSVQEAQARSKAALLKYDEESILIRETSDKFYGSLALFSGGKVVHDANFNKFKALMNARFPKIGARLVFFPMGDGDICWKGRCGCQRKSTHCSREKEKYHRW